MSVISRRLGGGADDLVLDLISSRSYLWQTFDGAADCNRPGSHSDPLARVLPQLYRH
jgi:hypothetical protein